MKPLNHNHSNQTIRGDFKRKRNCPRDLRNINPWFHSSDSAQIEVLAIVHTFQERKQKVSTRVESENF